MANLIAFLIGIVSLIIVIPAQIPFLGWANWIALPILAVGVLFGALSRSSSGFKFCLIVFAIACVRLFLGGGVF